ncbi:MAG TPA: protein YgfX [Burkholderiales bacterium]|nr:protein YgfX [Burkholderiales bacterium]
MSGTRLELARSWILAAAILFLHGTAAASALTILQGSPGIALAAAVLLLGIAAAWGRALHRSSASVRAIELSGDEITLELRDGRRLRAELGVSRHVSRFIVTLPVRRPLRRTILVTRDMLRAEEFRRLRLWALWGKVPVAAKQLTA